MSVKELANNKKRNFSSSFIPDMKKFLKLKEIEDINSIYDMPSAVKLGNGAHGEVFKVSHLTLNMEHALKVINKNKLNGPEEEDMMKELEVLESINHPHVMSVKLLMHDQAKYFIATELCEGGELFDHLVANGVFSEKKAIAVMK